LGSIVLVDSHCHLDLLDLSEHHGDLNKALVAANANDVGYFLCVCIDLENFPKVLHIAETYPDVSASRAPTDPGTGSCSLSQIMPTGSSSSLNSIRPRL